MTTPGGLTSAGLQTPTTAEVQKSIEQDQLATMDAALNLNPTQPLGQMNGIWSSAQANVWALLQAIYAAIDPNGAVGIQLDNLCALTGVTRLPATKTLVLCTLNINASQTYVPGQIVANVLNYPGLTFTNRDTVTSTTSGNYTGIVFVATQTGPIACNAGTLTVISPSVSGLNSITNPANGTLGTNIETDTALRLRRATLLVAAGGCTIDSIRASLLNPTLVPGIISASVLENNTLSTDGNGQPGKSFQPLIWDGPSPLASNTLIAQAIWNSKPSGIQSFGQTSAQATDATGKLQSVSFTRVTQQQIYFTITVKTNPLTFPAGGFALIQSAISTLLATFIPGQTVYAIACEAAALAIQGVLDVTSFFLDVNPSPAISGNIVMTPFQIATFNTCTVNVT